MRGDTKNKLNGSTQIYRGKNLKGKKNITYTENLIALLISMAIYSICLMSMFINVCHQNMVFIGFAGLVGW